MSRFDNFSFLSSGERDEDERITGRILKQEANEAEGLCPNGCAPVIWDDPHNYHCAVCEFKGWTNLAYKGRVP